MAQTNSNGVIIGTVAAVAISSVAIYFYLKRDHCCSKNSVSDASFNLKCDHCCSKKSKGKITLVDPDTEYALRLIEKNVVNRDTRKFRFGLPSDSHILGLPVGQHINLSAMIHGKLVVRPYTPISSDDDKGYVELMIKVYSHGVKDKYPKMSQYLESMKIGDMIDFRGPSGLIVYHGNGRFAVRKDEKSMPVPRTFKKVGMIARDSGITPMLQIITEILKCKNDKTEISLIFVSQTEKAILCRNELEALRDQHPTRFHLWYTVGIKPANWQYSSGVISDTMITEHLPPADSDTAILMCGPHPMITQVCIPILDKLAYPADLGRCRQRPQRSRNTSVAEDVPEPLWDALKVVEYADSEEPQNIIMAHSIPIQEYKKLFGLPLKGLQFHVTGGPRQRILFTGGLRSEPYDYYDAVPTHRDAWKEALLSSRSVPQAQKTLYRFPNAISMSRVPLANPHLIECAHSVPFPGFNAVGDPLLIPTTLPRGIRGFLRVQSHQFREEPLFIEEPFDESILPVNTPCSDWSLGGLTVEDERELEDSAFAFIHSSLKLTPKMIQDLYAERQDHLLAVSCLDAMAGSNDVFHCAISNYAYELAIPAEGRIDDIINLHNQTKLRNFVHQERKHSATDFKFHVFLPI